MAELSAVYASALLDLAGDNPGEYLEQAVFLRSALFNDECREMLAHPHMSAKDKRELFEKTFAGSINNHLLGFLYLVIEKNREAFLLPALDAFVDMINSRKGKTTANVVSAAELGEDQISALGRLLSEKLNKDVDVSVKVDPSVIGGLHIHVEGYLIDKTIKKQLHDMKNVMKEGVCGA